ncbi:MAG: WbqC family protein [Pseudarcicella sp.]|nr:WbqC family protein [Pseudarcicella sp.]
MKIAIMQPYIFPYIGYFQLINAVDKFIVYDDVSFINKGWINRNKILVNGQENTFTIPLIEASQNKLINTIAIQKKELWLPKLLKTIEQSYKKSPQFEEIFPIIQSIFQSEYSTINQLIIESTKQICNYLAIKTQIVDSSCLYNNQHLKAQERILDICKQENCTEYINPIGGIELYNKNDFFEKDIQLYFLKTKSIEYQQFKNNFVPYLSILDVLMFNSKTEIETLLNEYELL